MRQNLLCKRHSRSAVYRSFYFHSIKKSTLMTTYNPKYLLRTFNFSSNSESQHPILKCQELQISPNKSKLLHSKCENLPTKIDLSLNQNGTLTELVKTAQHFSPSRLLLQLPRLNVELKMIPICRQCTASNKVLLHFYR